MSKKKPELPALEPEQMIPFGGKQSREVARAIDGLKPDDQSLQHACALTPAEEAELLLSHDAVSEDLEE